MRSLKISWGRELCLYCVTGDHEFHAQPVWSLYNALSLWSAPSPVYAFFLSSMPSPSGLCPLPLVYALSLSSMPSPSGLRPLCLIPNLTSDTIATGFAMQGLSNCLLLLPFLIHCHSYQYDWCLIHGICWVHTLRAELWQSAHQTLPFYLLYSFPFFSHLYIIFNIFEFLLIISIISPLLRNFHMQIFTSSFHLIFYTS
jgi:hypothetical protein